MPPKTPFKLSDHPLLSAHLTSIENHLGPSLWSLYRQLLRNILQENATSYVFSLSTSTLFRLLQDRPAVAYCHNNLARAMRTDLDGAKIPTVGLSIRDEIPDEITHEYWEWCEKVFSGDIGLRKWIALVEAGEKVSADAATGKKANTAAARKKAEYALSPFLPFFKGPNIFVENMVRELQDRARVGDERFTLRVENGDKRKWELQLHGFLNSGESGDVVAKRDIEVLFGDTVGYLEADAEAEDVEMKDGDAEKVVEKGRRLLG
ncbi:hypothetical protein K458DRAFT_383015 [Lentithecium fluviatile CBS 122367]|uniref:Uncharacterized protein n=1 Tax=Lentithecium fluviatile CBS 122367 TaxID=1168545 RepID=A0A6G1JH65_9PLEO|nr:hypothetical protein K458DRAFT_383015 [Lentithecium fluviatile CBS 122367]